MAGSESSPASLLQLYVDYGRYAEATNLLLEYFDSVASVVSSRIFHLMSLLAYESCLQNLFRTCITSC